MKLVATRFFAWGGLPFLADQAHGLNNLPATLGREWDGLATRVEAAVRADDFLGLHTSDCVADYKRMKPSA